MIGPLAHTDEFNRLLGMFHYNWSATDLHVDYAIYQFLGITPLQAHLITSGMLFGRKIRLLVDLIKHSNHNERVALLAVLGRITKANRDIIAHAWVRSDANTVVFLERKISGPFSAKEHAFSLPEFTAHVTEVATAGTEFRQLLNVSSPELHGFANAALNINRK